MLLITLYIMRSKHLQNLGRNVFTRKYSIWTWVWHQGHLKYCPAPSTSCDVCNCKVWCCYVQQLSVDAFTIKYSIWPWRRGHRSHEMLPSACYILCIFFRDIRCPMHLQILKLPRRTVLKKMGFQENTLFDLWSRSHEMLPSILYTAAIG